MNYIYYLSLFFLVSLTSQLKGQSNLESTLYFNLDEHALTNTSKQDISNFVSELNEFTESHVEIIGHTDQQGSTDYNMALSKLRAESVRDYLVDIGYASNNIELRYLGESDPLLSDNDLESYSKNRRVTMVAEVYNYSNVNEFITQVGAHDPDRFDVNTDEEIEINLSQGTKVEIAPNSFCNLDGSPIDDENVEIKFKEAFDFSQMLTDKLSTRTSDQLLETGGMIYIEASQNGIPVTLRDGKEIRITLPKQNSKDGMELFTAIESEENIIWEETGEKISEEKEELFLTVDMSPIISFEFEYADTIAMPETAMPRYPKVLRKPQPPAQVKYSEEKYQELYQKYEEDLDAYYVRLKSRPQEVEAWHEEVNRRKKILIEHKKSYVSSYVKRWIEFQIGKIAKSKTTISNDKLVNALEIFLDRKVGDCQYDYLKHRNIVFGGALDDVLDHYELPTYNYSDAVMGDYCIEIHPAIKLVKRNIVDEKVRMGYVDLDVSRYVFSTSMLGWINCDRFLQLPREQLMDFKFAEVGEGQ